MPDFKTHDSARVHADLILGEGLRMCLAEAIRPAMSARLRTVGNGAEGLAQEVNMARRFLLADLGQHPPPGAEPQVAQQFLALDDAQAFETEIRAVLQRMDEGRAAADDRELNVQLASAFAQNYWSLVLSNVARAHTAQNSLVRPFELIPPCQRPVADQAWGDVASGLDHFGLPWAALMDGVHGALTLWVHRQPNQPELPLPLGLRIDRQELLAALG